MTDMKPVEDVPAAIPPTVVKLPPEWYEALGRLIYAAGLLEHDIVRVARTLRVPSPEEFSASRALQLTKQFARHGLPPWSAVELSQVTRWVRHAGRRIARRNSIVHSAGLLGWSVELNQWAPTHIAGRDGSRIDIDLGGLRQITSQIQEDHVAGVELWVGLQKSEHAGMLIAPQHRQPRPEAPMADDEPARFVALLREHGLPESWVAWADDEGRADLIDRYVKNREDSDEDE